MKKKTSKCIVIGGGRIALSHLPHLICHPDVELVGVVEPKFMLRFMLRKIFRINTFSSLKSLKRLNFDSAFVLTPPKLHYFIAKQLLNSGKHVFIEKPITLNPSESAELLEISKKNNTQFSCGYVYRFHPVFKEIKRILGENIYGYPLSCKISMRGNVVASDSPKSWRNVGKGSGCLYDYGCHVIDLSIFLFGKTESVLCLSKEELYQQGVIDRFSAELNHTGLFKLSSNITCDWSDENLRKAGIEIEIKTKSHNIYSDGQKITISGESFNSYSIRDLDTDVSFYLRGEEFQNQTDDFFESIVDCNLNYLNVEDAVFVDEVILQIYEQVM